MHKCLLCHSEFANRESLHGHLRFQEKVKIGDYYTEYFERRDWYDGEQIVWKGDVETYLASIFRNRINLIKYCKKFPDKAEAAITECIRARSELKNLTRMLSTVEARSVIYPTILLADSFDLDWCDIGRSINLTCRYNYFQKLEYHNSDDLVILQDQREQNPLVFDPYIKVLKNSLSFGDYTASSTHFNNLFVERKSLPDWAGTMSQGYDRFCRELVRADEFEARIVVLIESNLNNVFLIGKTPDTKKIKATPDFLFHRMREIMNNFENVQFLFVDGRKAAAKTLIKLLTLKNDVKHIDLQYLEDGKKW